MLIDLLLKYQLYIPTHLKSVKVGEY